MTLLLLASTAHALRLGIAPVTVHRATSPVMLSAEPSFWDKLLYGQGGKPAPPPPPPGPPTLAALFAQLDRNKDGKLSSLEMERALRQIKVPEEEWDSIFTALHCEADPTGCEVGEVEVTYNDFEARLPAAERPPRSHSDLTPISVQSQPQSHSDLRLVRRASGRASRSLRLVSCGAGKYSEALSVAEQQQKLLKERYGDGHPE